ncbi:hypothetical protein ARMGADRAFT_970782 [Armillaria gallica]|uniref:Peptidase C14 caspase domain-containing protein n=1 Tax=Armillaria gallica TaxID=47427 RepID=A0A2H3DCC0_ARMGA|nr:hypothetical protein ARMGADRAFT_970782 [Armillaria gallica]
MPHPGNAFTSAHEHAVPVADIESIEQQIVSHKMQEARIAKKYGIPGNVGSTAILQTVKDISRNSMDPRYSPDEFKRDAEALDALFKLRCRRAQLQEQRLPGPIPNSSEQTPKPMDIESPRALDPYRSWGVIIGIDAYQSSPLRGCVSDARAVHHYLVRVVGVPESHVRLLLAPCDSSPETLDFPSRTNIIETLHSFRTNPLIRKDDDIIIYFSGHGASYHCSDFFPSESGGTAHTGAIEAICPADRCIDDVNGRHIVPDISDRELNTILHLIRVEKGENITVITDCCYAGGVTREIPSTLSRGTIRNLPPLLDRVNTGGLELMLRAGDESLKEYSLPGTVSVLKGNWSPLNASHVLLAACTDYQFAREVRKDDGTVRGIFTEALMSALRSGPHTQSYHDLCCTISTTTPFQTPIAIGENSNKLFPWYPRF